MRRRVHTVGRVLAQGLILAACALLPPAAAQEQGGAEGASAPPPDAEAAPGDVAPAPEPAEAETPEAAAPEEPPATLMFSLQELIAIQAAMREGGLDREQVEESAKPRLQTPLYLSGILYSAPGDWTVWVNGQRMRPSEKAPLFEVVEVTARQVMLSVAWGETSRQVILEPNQTFLPSLGQVVEGRAWN